MCCNCLWEPTNIKQLRHEQQNPRLLRSFQRLGKMRSASLGRSKGHFHTVYCKAS